MNKLPFKSTVLNLFRAAESPLLQLQDQQGLSIPLLLWAAWLEASGRRLASLPESSLAALLTWEAQTVGPLRQLRRSLKGQLAQNPSLADLRASVAQCEQQAEWWLLAQLQQLPLDCGELSPIDLCLSYAGCTECEPIGALRKRWARYLNSQHQVS